MNRRLQAIAALVPDGLGMIDVGTDHGYLPVSLLRNGYRGKVFASDIREGPLNAALRTAEKAGLAECISFQLCDGLALCDPEQVDCIVIAGMGGDTVCGILDRAEWCMDRRYTLVLQPMTRPEVLRYWLAYNEFEIEREELVEDDGILYPILVARFGGKTMLNDAELFTGSARMLKEHPLFPLLLEQQIRRFEKTRDGLAGAGKNSRPERKKLVEEILSQMKEMKQE